MTKLKTLKDLSVHQTGGTDCVLTWELKAEAIKWVKANIVMAGIPVMTAEDFMKFHNITSEDLK